MLEITIVDDNETFLSDLETMLIRYGQENKEEFHIKKFSSSVDFLKEKTFSNIVFLDIVMPGCSGFDIAKFIRESDDNCIIVFITTMAQYAIKGYEYSALDFIVKPIKYESLVFKMGRILDNAKRKDDVKILLNVNYNVVSVDIRDIYYLESLSHQVVYHTSKGDYEVWTSLSKASEALMDHGFEFCNSCYLVNLKYVTGISDENVIVHDNELKISRNKKKQFIETYIKYIG